MTFTITLMTNSNDFTFTHEGSVASAIAAAKEAAVDWWIGASVQVWDADWRLVWQA